MTTPPPALTPPAPDTPPPAPPAPPAPTPPAPARLRPLPALIGTLILAAVLILATRAEGRRWWCACAGWDPLVLSAWSPHTSQHLLDPYTPSHISHGLLLCPLAALAARARIRGRRPAPFSPLSTPTRRYLLVCSIEVVWEVLENSPLIINRYRAATAALDYEGDTVINSAGDLMACAAGFLIAHRLGWRWALAIVLAFELTTLSFIRDNLTLNVLMLIWPLEAIKRWQTGGA